MAGRLTTGDRYKWVALSNTPPLRGPRDTGRGGTDRERATSPQQISA